MFARKKKSSSSPNPPSMKVQFWKKLTAKNVDDIRTFMASLSLTKDDDALFKRNDPSSEISYTPFQYLFQTFINDNDKRSIVDQFMTSFKEKLIRTEIDDYGMTELMDACQKGDLPRINFLLRGFTQKDDPINHNNHKKAAAVYNIGPQVQYSIHPTALIEALNSRNPIVVARVLHAMSEIPESNGNKADALLTLILDANADPNMIRTILNNMTPNNIRNHIVGTYRSLMNIANGTIYHQAIQDRLSMTENLHATDNASQDYTENHPKLIDAILIPTQFISDAVMDLENRGILDIVLYSPGMYALIPKDQAHRNPDANGFKEYKIRTGGDGYVILRFNSLGLDSVVPGVEEAVVDPTWMVMMALALI